MDGEEEKIFYSNITRIHLNHENNLNDLLNTEPAKPIPVISSENETSFFEPKCDKYYEPKKRSRLKVRTVREIRNQFEQDNYSYIIEDMEKQQCSLLTKIRTGSATDDNTKNMAKKLLNALHPISRTAWQMLTNINPEKKLNPTQFVLWNGRRIRVVGSKGGKTKFICNHDLEKKNIEETKQKCLEKNIKKKHRLLRDSLNIKFKPGPLRRKHNLDYSHQKFQMGPIELVKLPKPALDIQPSYGTVLEPIMSNFLNKLRPKDGLITEKWAEFAVSVVGSLKKNNLVQIDNDQFVTFDLSYKCEQNRILMRRDMNYVSINSDDDTSPKYALKNESDSMLEIKIIVDKMLDSVEISLKQDSLYSVVDESNNTSLELLEDNNINNAKEKNKKKYGELDRLAVTVIQLPGTPKKNAPKPCEKAFCHLGCICDSLNCTYKLKQHCGNIECMFGCKCEFSKYKDLELLENGCVELIPGLIKLDNEINANLAKEEQKFHQTVVFSGGKSILLKSRKRNAKSAKRYEEYYSNIRLKNNQEPKKILTIVDKKLNCSNIEPWCMVHSLYRCFCKGRFTETSAINMTASLPVTNIAPVENYHPCDNEVVNERNVLRSRMRHGRECSDKRTSICLLENNTSFEKCARTNEFKGRKYGDTYYKITNSKILEMEKNDKKLLKKMVSLMKNNIKNTSEIPSVIPLSLLNNSEDSTMENLKTNEDNHGSLERLKLNDTDFDKNNSSLLENTVNPSNKFTEVAKLDILSDNIEDSKEILSTGSSLPYEISGDIYKPLKGHLVTQKFLTPWIAKSYKNYKEQLRNGKSTLERPKRGKIILHLWECLLSRYRSRRNAFLTTTKKPFRIYIATDTSKPFFNNCIAIDDIRFEDLPKYPCVIKKLLINATNKDYFCILGGWDDCWEIIGSVKKNDSASDDPLCDTNLSNTESLSHDSDSAQENWDEKNQDDTHEIDKSESETNSLERSKWFLIKFENDFTEIYCHKKGFYVERDKIFHAIQLARITHKTVVINKQTNTETTSIPFGIYALPVSTEYCAVVGPYEIDESLGLEIVKAKMYVKQNSTKGFWITTNKIDNIKVLDDPMSFLPPKTEQNELHRLLTEKSIQNFDINSADSTDYSAPEHPSTSQKKSLTNVQDKNSPNKDIVKVVKPIKIRRTNGFYHLTSKNNIVKKVLPTTPTSVVKLKSLGINSLKPIIINNPKSLYNIGNHSDTQIINKEEINALNASIEPEAEASHLKITSVYSVNEELNEMKKPETKKTGMFVLKPEEINQRISHCTNEIKNEISMNMDIEHFLSFPRAGAVQSIASDNNNVLLISDEEDNTKNLEEVWIQCSNIKSLGWIQARRNEEKLLTNIDFFALKYTDFYNESEVFAKINKVLAKKMNIRTDINVEWEVTNQCSAMFNGLPLKTLFRRKRLTTKCKLIQKRIIEESKRELSTETCDDANSANSECERANTPEPQLFEDPPNVLTSQTPDIIEGLENTSRLLEDQSIILLNETDKIQTDIIQKLNLPEELKPGMSETLQDLMALNDNCLIDD